MTTACPGYKDDFIPQNVSPDDDRQAAIMAVHAVSA